MCSLKDPTVTISILTYNRSSVLRESLDALKQIEYKNLEIIVVDNNSSDNTSDLADNLYPEFKYIRLPRNMGVEARNVGIINSKGHIIIMLAAQV